MQYLHGHDFVIVHRSLDLNFASRKFLQIDMGFRQKYQALQFEPSSNGTAVNMEPEGVIPLS